MTDWQGLLNLEGNPVWRAVYRILGNAADAEECFQEVFLAVRQRRRRGGRDSEP